MLISLHPAILAALLLSSSSSSAPRTAVIQAPTTAEAAPPARGEPAQPTSLDRIRKAVARPPSLNVESNPPNPTFKTTIEERVVMVPFQEYLRQQFELTPLQRQSQEWASRCCGIDLGRLVEGIEKALERRKARQVREQITREVAELEAARAR